MYLQQSVRQRIIRILTNLSYLIGEWLARRSRDLTQLRRIIDNFVQGWLDTIHSEGKTLDAVG